jgi:hypothetical protein
MSLRKPLLAASRKPRPLWLGTEDRYARLRKIESLDPVKNSREIAALFYADFQSIMVLKPVTTNLMTYAAPRMSRILIMSGEVEHRTTKRFVDTALLMRAVMQNGFGAGDGRDAARRINAMHHAYDIHPDDFVVVGCDVPLMSLEAADKFGWRPVTDAEREALRIHESKEARIFGSHKALPDTLEEMRLVWENYMDTELAFEPQNARLTKAFLDFVPTTFPAALRPLANPVLTAQVDPRILRACGLRVPSAARKRFSTAVLRAIGRRDPVPDPTPGKVDKVTALAKTVYPCGYSIDRLGTHLGPRQGRQAAND